VAAAHSCLLVVERSGFPTGHRQALPTVVRHMHETVYGGAGLTSSAESAPALPALQEHPLLAVMAVVGDYEHADLRARLRKAWYPGGSRKALEDCLGAPSACTTMPLL
jgi:hypothetical protein